MRFLPMMRWLAATTTLMVCWATAASAQTQPAGPEAGDVAGLHEDVLGNVPALDSLNAIRVSADCRHVAWVQKAGEGVEVLCDNKPPNKVEWVLPRSLVFSGDGQHLAYTIQRGKDLRLVVDGREGAAYESIGSKGQALFSPDSQHVAYVARPAGQKPRMVLDDREQEPLDDIDYVVFSRDSKRLAYCATRGNQICVVVDGHALKFYDNLGSLPVFTADSRRVAFTARKDGQWFAVIDGVEEPGFDEGAGELHFSPDSQRITYAAARRGKLVVVADGVESREFDAVSPGTPLFSPDSRHVAYIGRLGQSWRMVVDQSQGPVFDSGMGLPVFSPDSSRLAYTVSRGKSFAVIVNGVEQKPYDQVLSLSFSPDSRHLAYLAHLQEWEFMVVDGQGQGEHLHCSAPAFSPDSRHLAYGVADSQGATLVIDGQSRGRTYQTILDDGRVAFDADGCLWAMGYRDGQLLRLHWDCAKVP